MPSPQLKDETPRKGCPLVKPTLTSPTLQDPPKPSPNPTPMTNLRAILLALALAGLIAFALWAFATGPDLLEIIDNPKF